jgi:hypothetical protein
LLFGTYFVIQKWFGHRIINIRPQTDADNIRQPGDQLTVPASHTGVSCSGCIFPLIALEYMFGTLRRITGLKSVYAQARQILHCGLGVTFFNPLWFCQT